MNNIIRLSFVSLSLTLVLATISVAAVTGACSNCHTMHNSQGNSSLNAEDSESLLVNNCVGCHTSTGTETIVNLGSARVPIVYNTGGYPEKPLAGGNFYDVATKGGGIDSHGHNVYGVSGVDGNLNHAPVDLWGMMCGTTTCHDSLAEPKSTMNTNFDGCQICHQKFKHHGMTLPDGMLEIEESGGFRFLGGHDAKAGNIGPIKPSAFVIGIEDSDWEQDPDTGHNGYYETAVVPGTSMSLQSKRTLSSFCLGCHCDAHDLAWDNLNSIWLRHPTSILLPNSGEFAAYDPVTAYDATVPVGWINPSSPIRSQAVVMCLSCHRPHGSEYPDMLRWDYAAMTAGAGSSNEGCFKCHSSKDI